MKTPHLTDLMRSLKIPALLVTLQTDLAYLTGVNLEGFWLLVTPGESYVIAPKLIAGQLASLLPGLAVSGTDSMLDQLGAICKKIHVKSSGIDTASVTYSLFNRINDKVRLRPANDLVTALRMVKDTAEISAIRTACRITVAACKYAHSIVQAGMTESRLSFKIEEYFASRQVRPSFLPIVASGPNTADPHHISGGRRIGKNDVLLIDIGCVYKGYCADLTRTCILGKISHLTRTVYALTERAQKETIRALRPGIKARQADSVARSIIAEGGYGSRFIHTTGHGIGVEVHESPRLGPKDETVIKPGMVVTVEPGIYLSDKFGVRIEDTVLVTEKGCEVLTK